MNDLQHFNLYTYMLDDCESVNKQLVDGLHRYINEESTRKSHQFFGRFENIYIDNDKIPALSLITKSAISQCAQILDCAKSDLKAGLWFNVMNPGDKTTLHRHDDFDELLSAVYYVQVAENSGTLHLKKQPVDIQVTPKQGMFVFFSPEMPHEVSENLSQQCRISLGINIGPA